MISDNWKPNNVYTIEGGFRLEGEISLGGAKNAITKQLVASTLTDEECIFFNVPRNYEVSVVLEMLQEIGTTFQWIDSNTLKIQTASITKSKISKKYSGSNRIPILLLGPLIHRAGCASVPMVGGCNIGPRPVDFHINALQAMGINFTNNDEELFAKADIINGEVINLAYPSVGATENILLTAVLSKGITVITNAAIEPEIIDTILFLQKMGALIQVDADRKIIIEGVSKLRGATHRVISDRIEAASFAVAAVMTNGKIKLINAKQEHMISFLNCLRRIGGGYSVEDDGITFFKENDLLKGLHMETDVYPGFATDWQPPLVVLLTQAQGVSVIHETVYENRLGFTSSLADMGALIATTSDCLGGKECRFKNRNFQHSCVIQGATPLKGVAMEIPDLRAGFAYIVAALAAKGTSVISGIPYVERGYEDLLQKLSSINAHIKAK